MIDKSKIKRYVASGILGATILTGTGLAMNELKFDHTEELCPITKILNIINPKDSSPLGIVMHQIPAMQADYKEKGMGDVGISYLYEEEIYIETKYAKPIGTKLTNGETEYISPDGYELYLENGKYKCKKEVTKTILHHDLVADIPYAKKLRID